MSPPIPTRILIFLLLLIITGCATTSGNVQNGVYYSKSGSFEIPIPHPSRDLHISDAYDKTGEMVRFDIPYSFHNKLERFRVSQHEISDIVKSQSIDFQLRLVESNLFELLGQLGATTEEVLLTEIRTPGNQAVLITVRRISGQNIEQIRGVLISIGQDYVNTFHYTHPAFTEQDVQQIIVGLEEFYGSAIIHQP